MAPGCGTSAGGRRSSSAVGSVTTANLSARIDSTDRQSWLSSIRAAMGDMVTGASPIPAETRDTARLRCVMNQPVTLAIIGANNAAMAPPANRPKQSLTSASIGACPAARKLSENSAAPASITGLAP